ncbi:MRG-domain-containing protein [Gorgonomyces haynaldii]|nr:MRG-domain-containing protein [Gorgonomyces haynaldii]
MSEGFSEGEKVLCFHGPLMYEAKVRSLTIEYWSGRPDGLEGHFYFVHYRGWKQSWDEWVSEERVMKYSPENLVKQQELRSTQTARKVAKIPEKKPTAEAPKKRRRDSTAEREEDFIKRPEIKIMIPDALKTLLVEDWESVTKNQKLVALPRAINVNDVLNRYQDYIKEGQRRRGAREGRSDESLGEVIDGLRVYFDRALGNILLYRFERQQYVDIKKQYPEKAMSEIYGAEHLLRLFVHMPSIIAHTNMEQDAVHILKDHFTQFLGYLLKFQKELFIEDYEPAPPSYVQAVKGN